MKISYENLEFPCELKEKILKLVNTSKIDVHFVCGRKIVLSNTNLGLEDPNRVIISNKAKYLEVLVYEQDDSFYIQDFAESLSLTRLVKIVNKYL